MFFLLILMTLLIYTTGYVYCQIDKAKMFLIFIFGLSLAIIPTQVQAFGGMNSMPYDYKDHDHTPVSSCYSLFSLYSFSYTNSPNDIINILIGLPSLLPVKIGNGIHYFYNHLVLNKLNPLCPCINFISN